MASQSNAINYSALPWYTSLDYQNHAKQARLGYGNGKVWPLVAEKGFLPPFQIIRTTDLADPITSFSVYSVEANTTTDILANIVAEGLEVKSYSTYDIITYPANDDMAGALQTEGQYYAIMSDGTNTWYSEMFYIRNSVADLIRLNFWHDEPFLIPPGHIQYNEPFANYLFFDSVINAPTFPSEQEVNDVDGYVFPLYLVSKKVFRFYIQVPEFIVDLLRLVEHHHFKNIEFDGITYYPVYFKIDISEPVKTKHLYGVLVEFAPDTTVQTTGKVKPETEGNAYDQTAYDDGFL